MGRRKGLRQLLKADKGRARAQTQVGRLHAHSLHHLSWVKPARGLCGLLSENLKEASQARHPQVAGVAWRGDGVGVTCQ